VTNFEYGAPAQLFNASLQRLQWSAGEPVRVLRVLRRLCDAASCQQLYVAVGLFDWSDNIEHTKQLWRLASLRIR
jgi:hypothetical protein